jgi:hypothetical protein
LAPCCQIEMLLASELCSFGVIRSGDGNTMKDEELYCGRNQVIRLRAKAHSEFSVLSAFLLQFAFELCSFVRASRAAGWRPAIPTSM